jgi:hypothetical protein
MDSQYTITVISNAVIIEGVRWRGRFSYESTGEALMRLKDWIDIDRERERVRLQKTYEAIGEDHA